MSLNPRQTVFVAEYLKPEDAARLLAKLSALQELSRMFLAARGHTDPHPLFVAACLLVIAHPQTHPIRKAAAAHLLDMTTHGWRAHVGPAVLGEVIERTSAEARGWRKAVLTRDGFACVECGETEGLEAHHLVRWVDAPWLRLVVDNGKTLCVACHLAVHRGAHA